jgi:PIN domain nuclease of toxin-antitoxin system
MRILLVTHTFLYWSVEPDRLPKNLLILLSNPSNQVILSVVSSWEAQIKIGLGKFSYNLIWNINLSKYLLQ